MAQENSAPLIQSHSDSVNKRPHILDIGCGAAKIPGAIGIDVRPGLEVDVVHNLNVYPWPFEDNTFDKCIFSGSLECLDSVLKSMEEVHRITRPGGRVEIHTTHFAASNSYWDPLQKWHFSYYTFDYFLEDFTYPIYTDRKYRMIRKEFIFSRKWGLGRILSTLSTRRYEKYYARRFPPYRLFFELEVIKGASDVEKNR